jgi:hypothetical protein
MCSTSYRWISHNAGFGFLDLAPSILHSTIGYEITFPSALCLICPPGYLGWSITFLLGVGLTDLGDFGRYWYWGQNKAIVGIFNGSVVYLYCDVGVVLIFFARFVLLVKNFTSSYFDFFGAVEYR